MKAMKGGFGLIIFAIAIMGVVSCASYSRPYYNPLKPAGRLEGKAVLAGCQIKKSAIRSMGILGVSNTVFSLSWKSGDPLIESLVKHLDREALKAILIKPFPDDYYRKMRAKENKQAFRPSNSVAASGFYPIGDTLRDPGAMDKTSLDTLNEFSDAGLYVVFDADIIDAIAPHIFNFMEFTLEYEVSMIVYDRSGKKLLSRHYSKRYERLDATAWNSSDVYFDMLDRTVEAFGDQISSDIREFLPAPPATGDVESRSI
jgi:hypothetical protein